MTKLKDLEGFFKPKSVAFYGASNMMQKFGSIHLTNLLSAGYKGKMFPIHPKEDNILGFRAYKNIQDVPDQVDLAVMAINPDLVNKFLEECGQKGIKYVIILSGGFSEVGNEQAQNKMKQIAEKYDQKILGPNCSGEVITPSVNITHVPWPPRKGGVSIVSQSGTYAVQPLIAISSKIGVGISKIISVGNEVNTDLVDFLEALEEDEETTSIGIYFEAVRRGKEFIDLITRINLKKPIVIIPIGQTEAGTRSAKSHTAAITSPGYVIDSICEQTGAIKVKSSIDMLNLLNCFDSLPLPKGNRVAILTLGGGPGTLMSDLFESNGMKVPMLSKQLQEKLKPWMPETASTLNPIDLTYSDDMQNFLSILPDILLKSNEIDSLIFYGLMGTEYFKHLVNVPDFMKDHESVVTMKNFGDMMEDFFIALFDEIIEFKEKYKKPIIITCYNTREEKFVAYLQDHGIPVYYPEEGVWTLIRMWEYSEFLKSKGG
ncbi:MAG: acetate--CoA ligase family protein [Candidatus Heimdallarchaeota archaeon]